MDDDDDDTKIEETVVKQAEGPELNLLAPPKYEVRPKLVDRFPAADVKEIIDQTMREILTNRSYSGSQAEKWVRVVSNQVRERVNKLPMQRYKVIVQVVLGEMRGSGIKSGVRCLWDSECDNFTTHTFYSDSIFCNTTVFGVYYY